MVAHSSSSGVEPEAVATEAAASPRGDLARAPVRASRRELGSSAPSLMMWGGLALGKSFGFSFSWPCLASCLPFVVVLFCIAIAVGRFYSFVTASPIHLFCSLNSAFQAPEGQIRVSNPDFLYLLLLPFSLSPHKFYFCTSVEFFLYSGCPLKVIFSCSSLPSRNSGRPG